MIAVPQQREIEVSVTNGVITMAQADSDGNDHYVEVAVENLDRLIEALKGAAKLAE